MNWLNAKYASESVAILVLSGCALYAVHDFHETNVALRAGVVQTLGSLNAPCKDIHGDVVCGPIPQLSQTEKDIGILAAQGAEQTKQSGKLVIAATQAVNSAAQDIKASLQPLPGAITALTGTAHSASGMLRTAQATIRSFQPVAGDADATVRHFDDLIQSPAIAQTLQNVSATTAHINAIAADSYTVEHRYFFRPACRTLGCRMKSVAMFAYGAGKMAETGYWVKQLILGGSQ